MQALVVYFIKANITLAILYGCYRLLLANEKRFMLNRFILAGIIATSCLLPLVSPGMFSFKGIIPAEPLRVLYKPFQQQANNTAAVITTTRGAANGVEAPLQAPADAGGYLSLICFGVYLSVLLALGFRYGRQVWLLRRFLQKEVHVVYDGIKYAVHNKPVPPFSFFGWLAINKSSFSAEQYEQVIAHEKIHIKEWHSIDILVAQATAIIFWINPAAHYLKQRIKLNLEYLADEGALATGLDSKQYQLNVVQISLNANGFTAANLFTSSKLKQRIKMINKAQNRRHWYKYIVAPLAIAAAWCVINPIAAKPPIAKHIAAAPAQAYERLYVVLNAKVDKQLLGTIKQALAERGITFTSSDEKYKDGKLTSLSVKFSAGSTFSGGITNPAENLLVTKPIIFFYEPSAGFHVLQGAPLDDMSNEGRKLVTNNLTGVMIINKDGGQEMHGSAVW